MLCTIRVCHANCLMCTVSTLMSIHSQPKFVSVGIQIAKMFNNNLTVRSKIRTSIKIEIDVTIILSWATLNCTSVLEIHAKGVGGESMRGGCCHLMFCCQQFIVTYFKDILPRFVNLKKNIPYFNVSA